MVYPGSNLLGRYVYYNPQKNSNKFWECTYNPETKRYDTKWGRNGNAPQDTKCGLDAYEAEKKIREKMSKGYSKTETMKVIFEEKLNLKAAVAAQNQAIKDENDVKAGKSTKASSTVKAVRKML